ncbi:hypothetical protein [Roseivirga sp. E12]|uniref:hypothetical protein n=1 Tax=Roseivirga sp. E12 TaxID=2819237 RepID=UPI001ABC4FA0|nr:hypothetical protein [Roseivirga sp. E12]MBO3696830.1 hypothetical protein [Roseivirga sp. E12]
MSRLLNNSQLTESKKAANQSKAPTSLEPGTSCSYSNTTTLPHSKSAEGLASWLSQPHPGYNMASLDFYGHLIPDNGDIVGFSSMIQQQFGLPGSAPYLAEFSICNNETDGVVVAPFLLDKDKVTFQSNPFSETANLNLLIEDEKITIALVSGKMGQPGAKYKLTGNAIAFDLANWVYEVELTDSMGTVAIGYGPSSFLPQWLNAGQHQAVMNEFGGNVETYLQDGQDNMSGEGSYYYSLPILQVTSFNITKDGKPFSSGSQGHLWVDYVTQSFSEASYPVLKNDATWQFLAIQFPPQLSLNDFSGALMFSQVEMPIPGSTGTSTLPTARFYHSHSAQEPNTALKAWHDWDIQDISFESSDLWPKEGDHQFPLKFTLTLGKPGDENGYAILKGEAVRPNQEVTLVHKYEGVYKVTGSIHVDDFHLDTVFGYAWAEIH